MGKISIKEKLAMNSRKIAESNAKTNLPDSTKIENDTLEPKNRQKRKN